VRQKNHHFIFVIAKSPDLNPLDYSLSKHSNSLFTVLIAFQMSAPERSSANLLGADWSRHYRLHYRTVLQTIVARCCNRLSTALTSVFGASCTLSYLHVLL